MTRDAEEELHLLRRDIKLTSLPKRQAMELLRRKIEARIQSVAQSAQRQPL